MAADVTVRVNNRAFYHAEAPVERVIGYDAKVSFFAKEEVYAPDA